MAVAVAAEVERGGGKGGIKGSCGGSGRYVSGGGKGKVNGNSSRKGRCTEAAMRKVYLRFWQYKQGRTAVGTVVKEGQMVAAGER